MNKNLVIAIIRVATLCIIVFAVSAFFIYNTKAIGWVILGLGGLCLWFLYLFKVPIKKVLPDIIFGVIDNGILAIFAVIGAEIAGVAGAIVGGVVGNSITDGIAGIFEGHMAEKLRKQHISEERTIMGSAIGKMAGCLLGAGVILIIAKFIDPLL